MAVPLYDAAGLELPRGHPGAQAGGDPGHAPRRRLHRRRGRGHRAPRLPAVPAGRRRRRAGRLVRAAPDGGAAAAPPGRGHRRASRKGDLSRVILAERDDEIGTIAGRFNAMTGSLREAREEGERGGQRAAGPGGAAAPRRRSWRPSARWRPRSPTSSGTPLNVIGGRARALDARRRGDAAARSAKNAGIISGEVARITKIIHQVLDFSRPRGPTLTRVQLGVGGRRGAGVRGRDRPAAGHRRRRAAPRRRRPRCPAIPIRSSRSA